MAVKFITSRIYTGKPTKSVADIIKEAQAANGVLKTASSNQQTKQANLANLGDKKAPPFGKKDEECDEDEKEVKEGCDDKKATAKAKVKLAEEKEVETYDAGKKEDSEFTNDAKKEPEKDGETKFTGGDPKPEPKKGKDGLPTSGQPQWEGKQENVNNPEMPTDKNTKASASKTVKVSVPSGKHQVLANMKPELKKRTREYWLTLYPADYVDAMIADK